MWFQSALSRWPPGDSDAVRIVAARGARSFAYELLGVALGVALVRRGLTPGAVGALISVSLAGDFCGTYAVALAADRWGRRRTLVVLALLMALYFHLRFGAPLAALAVQFFGANSLAALSFLAAAPLARRFGRLNTMVFTHLPSNLLLILVALMPTFPLAAGVLLARQALSQMDVPTRQAYTMALVVPVERTAAASVTSLARSAGSAASPLVSGILPQGPLLVLGLPFIAAGTLKAAYDLTLWRVFMPVRLSESHDAAPGRADT